MKKRVLAVVMCALMAGTAFTGFKDAGDDKELVLFYMGRNVPAGSSG